MELKIEDFHNFVDDAVSKLLLQIQVECKQGCTDCCIDNLSVFKVEADLIIQNCKEILQEDPSEVGACPFLDAEKSCRIYKFRPYVCRTQGLPLRWLEEDTNEETVEYRDICPLNENCLDITQTTDDKFWTIGPHEELLSAIQYSKYRNMERVSLRSLFKNNSSSSDYI